MLHGVKVGQVLERKLTAKGVTFQVAIDPEYRDLIHGDSKFVVNSRLDVKVGLDGVQVLGASASEWVKRRDQGDPRRKRQNAKQLSAVR